MRKEQRYCSGVAGFRNSKTLFFELWTSRKYNWSSFLSHPLPWLLWTKWGPQKISHPSTQVLPIMLQKSSPDFASQGFVFPVRSIFVLLLSEGNQYQRLLVLRSVPLLCYSAILVCFLLNASCFSQSLEIFWGPGIIFVSNFIEHRMQGFCLFFLRGVVFQMISRRRRKSSH